MVKVAYKLQTAIANRVLLEMQHPKLRQFGYVLCPFNTYVVEAYS